MRLLIGMTVEPDIAMALIKEIVEFYDLKLIEGIPIIIAEAENKAVFFVECSNLLVIDKLDADTALDAVWCDPKFYKDYNDDQHKPVGETAQALRLEALFRKDVDLNG